MMIFYFGGGIFSVLFVQSGISQCLWPVWLQVQKKKKARRAVQQSWLHEVSKSKVALAVFCISFTAFTGQSPRRFSRIVPVHAIFFSVIRLDILEESTVCWFQGNLASLLFISGVRVTPLSLVLCQCGSLFWRWCSTCSRKLSSSLGHQYVGCRRDVRWCLQDVWWPFWNFIFVTVGKCCHSSRHGSIMWREGGNGLCN